jgi:hypothetical protein
MRRENLNKKAVFETLRRKWNTMQNHLDERSSVFGRQLKLRH